MEKAKFRTEQFIEAAKIGIDTKIDEPGNLCFLD